jgi:hypothetical protein
MRFRCIICNKHIDAVLAMYGSLTCADHRPEVKSNRVRNRV